MTQIVRESAADTAAAKTLVGHFVEDRNSFGPSAIYKVDSVNEDGSATLHGPIGKGGTKTVSHSDLVKNHIDRGPSDSLPMVSQESQTNKELFNRFLPKKPVAGK